MSYIIKRGNMKINIIDVLRKEGLSYHMKYLILNSKNKYNIIKNPKNLSKFSLVNYFQAYQHVKSKLTSEDICYFEDVRSGYIRYFIKNLPKTVFWCYDVSSLSLGHFSFKKKLWIKFNLLGMKKAKRIITSSEDSKREMNEYTGYPLEKINVVYCAADRNIFKMYDSKKKSI